LSTCVHVCMIPTIMQFWHIKPPKPHAVVLVPG
jgi:hypothetical protein